MNSSFGLPSGSQYSGHGRAPFGICNAGCGDYGGGVESWVACTVVAAEISILVHFILAI